MASISANTFVIHSSTKSWFPDPERKSGQVRYFELRARWRRWLERDYFVILRDDGSYEVLRRSEIMPMGQRWPDACRKIGFAVILAITNEIGDPWAP